MRLIQSPLLAAPLIIAFLLGCSGAEKAPAAAKPTAAPASPSATLRSTAEARYLPAMTSTLAGRIREQPWYESMSPAHLDMIALIRDCEKAAQRRGETASVAEVLSFASEQGWYQDGLDNREATALGAIFLAYTESLEDDYAPPIGPMISKTIRSELFEVVAMAESGQIVLLVAAEDAKLGRRALEIASQAMVDVEGVIGRFPYKFLYLEVTPDLPVFIAGLSYDEFITIADDYVDKATIVHEITHSTLYGIFPTWFEEGFAHFLEYYLTGEIPAGTTEYSQFLRVIGSDSKLDLRPRRAYTELDALVERAQGFLFLKELYSVIGIEGMSKTVRSLRTQSATGQDLIRTVIQQAPVETQPQLTQLVCQRVVGTTRNYCVSP